jgi:hypothetical protein
MKLGTLAIVALTIPLATPGLVLAWGSANRFGGSTSHSYGSTSHTSAWGTSTWHAAGEGTSHTNVYGGSTSHAYGGGATHTNAYGGTTSGEYGQGATHTTYYGASAYHPPGAPVGLAVGTAAASANTSNAYSSGYAAGSANASAATASAYNAGVAAAPTSYVMGVSYAALPAGCISPSVKGGTYYLCGNTRLKPSYGANGVHYVVVPTP